MEDTKKSSAPGSKRFCSACVRRNCSAMRFKISCLARPSCTKARESLAKSRDLICPSAAEGWLAIRERLADEQGVFEEDARKKCLTHTYWISVDEAERIVENLTEFDLQDVGNKQWLEQHGQWLRKLGIRRLG